MSDDDSNFMAQQLPLKLGYTTSFRWDIAVPSSQSYQRNDLIDYFDGNKSGHGIWKFRHYFDIYERHFGKFRGKEVHILEIGIYSGGSLPMWRQYFGDRAHVYGVDIQPECLTYASDNVKIFIGDQGDRAFWQYFCSQVPHLDIVVDDGSHVPEHQRVTLEELLPHLRPGGVFLVEDMHGDWVYGPMNPFASYVHGLAHQLNAMVGNEPIESDLRNGYSCAAQPFQSAVNSIHLYPYVAVIERNDVAASRLACPKHGTEWQPFNPGQPRTKG